MTGMVVVVAGVGPGLGSALVAAYRQQGHLVATISRGPAPVPSDHHVVADLARETEVNDAVEAIAKRLGPVNVYVHNAATLRVGPFLELEAADFAATWETTVLAAAFGARAVLPSMLARTSGALVFVGATASIKGGAHFAAFASAKFALRGLAQSLAREFQPQGVHVCHVILDGLMRGTPSVARFGGSEERSLDPGECARAIVHLCQQSTGAWTHELDLRPMMEKF